MFKPLAFRRRKPSETVIDRELIVRIYCLLSKLDCYLSRLQPKNELLDLQSRAVQ